MTTPNKTCYTVQELARLSGVSVRTLHYYDEKGLLTPLRQQNNYRWYGAFEVDRLQQILLYREIGISLDAIKQLLDDPTFDEIAALKEHLQNLKTQQERIRHLVESVEKTIAHKERNEIMSDTEKFTAFKKKLIEENEQAYGEEIREKYGDDTIDASNAKMMNMSEEKYRAMKETEAEMLTLLHQAMEKGDPAAADAQKACDLHRQWLEYTWKDGMYSKEAHLGLGSMYVSDERFKAYYDSQAPGSAEFLLEALKIYCQ